MGITRTAEILEALRRDVVEARLNPGQRLQFDELRKNYSVGIFAAARSVEAACLGSLVISEQRRGFRVAPVSRGDLYEILAFAKRDRRHRGSRVDQER